MPIPDILIGGYHYNTHGIMLPVSRCLPQFAVVDVGRDDLPKASLPVLTADVGHQGVVDVGSARQEETAAGTQFVEEVELLVLEEVQVTQALPARRHSLHFQSCDGLSWPPPLGNASTPSAVEGYNHHTHFPPPPPPPLTLPPPPHSPFPLFCTPPLSILSLFPTSSSSSTSSPLFFHNHVYTLPTSYPSSTYPLTSPHLLPHLSHPPSPSPLLTSSLTSLTLLLLLTSSLTLLLLLPTSLPPSSPSPRTCLESGKDIPYILCKDSA